MYSLMKLWGIYCRSEQRSPAVAMRLRAGVTRLPQAASGVVLRAIHNRPYGLNTNACADRSSRGPKRQRLHR